MTEQIKNSPKDRRICEERINYAKLKVDGANAASNDRDQDKAPVSRQSEQHAQLHIADDSMHARTSPNGKEAGAMTEFGNGTGPDDLPTLFETLGIVLEATPKPTAKLDIEMYQEWLDDLDATDEEKREVFEIFARIVFTIIDMGFGVAPLHVACGELAEAEGFCGRVDQDVVSSKAHTLSDAFNQIAVQ